MVSRTIQIQEICQYFASGAARVKALDTVNMSLDAGELVALMGPSGCGKSTLLKILGLQLKPSSGIFTLCGEAVPSTELKRAQMRNQRIGFVHQDYAIVPHLSALDNVRIPLEYARPSMKKVEQKLRGLEVLEQVGLAHMAATKASLLSGGERQRISIARAMVGDPTILLADEPTAALDSNNATKVMDIFWKLAQSGVCIVVATHDARVSRRCNRVVELVDGKIVNDSILNLAQ